MVTCSQQGGKQTSSEENVWGFVQLSPSLWDILALGMGGTWGTEGAGPGGPRGSGQELLLVSSGVSPSRCAALADASTCSLLLSASATLLSPTPGCWYMAHGVFSCPNTLESTSGTPHHTPSSCTCPLPGHCGIVCHEFSLTLEIFFEFPQWTRREKAKINHIPVGVPHRVPTNRLTMQQLLGFNTCFP